MADKSERQALLTQEHSPHSDNRGDGGSSSDDSQSGSGSDDWWDGSGSVTGSSCSSSYSSGSFSEEFEWEAEVSENGELFFIESDPRPQVELAVESSAGPDTAAAASQAGVGLKVPRKKYNAKAKLVRMIRRRNSKRLRGKVVTSGLDTHASSSQADGANIRSPAGNKVTFQDWQEGEVREVQLSVDPSAAHNLGRRATPCEILLGVVTTTFADESRIMVAGFIPNGEAMKHRSIKIGDWLRSVDGHDVNVLTLDSVLAGIKAPGKVTIKVQRVAGREVRSPTPPINSPQPVRQSNLVQHLIGTAFEDELTTLLRGLPVGLLYLTQEGLSESGPEDQGVLYCYPPPVSTNALGLSRGSFITLHHLMPEFANSHPVSSTVLLRGELTHVIYTTQPNSELMLLAIPDTRCSLQEALLVSSDLVRNLQFNYQTLGRGFSNNDNHPTLDHFFSLFFARLLSSGLWPSARQSVRLEEIISKSQIRAPPQFEDIMPAARRLSLPRETQVQIDEALSELEANDFGDMNDDLSGYQRLYTIIGTCLFHQGYLLASHLQQTDLVDVTSFCRQQGLLHLGREEPVRSLVVWRRVFPASTNRGLELPPSEITPYGLPQGKWFVLIVGKGQEMLVVLLESGGCTIRAEANCGPDVVYVEQAQDTLHHIQKLGVAAVAAEWLRSSARPQLVSPEDIVLAKPTTGFLGLTPTKLAATAGISLGASSLSVSPLSLGKKTPEVTSILKRRGVSPERSLNISGLSSEDSQSRGAPSLSEMSDDLPILGRRAERERGFGDSASKLSDSQSDSDYYKSDTRSYDLPDKRPSFLADVEHIVPSKLTAGEENVLFHYVQLDLTDGVLMCSPDNRENSERLTEILHNFRRSSLTIHSLFQNTIKFKKMGSQERTKAPVNTSLVAIKEHGILFECSANDTEGSKKSSPLTYWVVGRLFFTPLPKEVYICYHDSAPQNMVEIAFRLGMYSCG